MIRNFIAVLFMSTLLLGFLSSSVLALDPSEEQASCFGQSDDALSSEGNSCADINCGWRNISYNWPEDTGYQEDCSGEAEQTSIGQTLNESVQNPDEPQLKSLRDKAVVAAIIITTIGTSILWIIVRAGTKRP